MCCFDCNKGAKLYEILGILGFKYRDILNHIVSYAPEKFIYDLLKEDNGSASSSLDIDILLDRKLYKPILLIESSKYTPIFESKKKFLQILDDLKSSDKALDVALLIRSFKTKFWNISRFWRFYRACAFMLEQDSMDSPLTFTTNPLVLAILLHLMLKKLNRKLRLDAKDVENLAKEFLSFCEQFIYYSCQDALSIYILETDASYNNFLDYVFYTEAKNLATTSFINQVVDNMWDQNRFLKNS